MKTLKNTAIAVISALTMFLVSAFTQAVHAQPGGHVSFQLFYDELAPYGEWIDDPNHGYIWLPDAGPDFRPYATNGHWVMTSYGNTWMSNYSWGWAPFHYGRWIHTDYYGWAWVPGYEWGPAWVSWRNGGGYYGWAPLGPRMGIQVHLHVNIPSFHWVFVPQRYVCSPYVYRYYTPHRNIVNIYNRTTIINNTYVYNNRTYISGPRRSDLERATRSRITVREVHNANRPGRASVDARSVNIYRPEVSSSRGSARPARVADRSAIRPDRGTSNNIRNSGSSVARPSQPRAEAPRQTTAPRNETARPQTSERQRPAPQAREQRSAPRPQPSAPVHSTRSTETRASGSAARPARSSEPAQRSTARPASGTTSSRATQSSGSARSERSSSARPERGSR